MQSTSANGAQVAFQFFVGWTPDDALALIEEAREWADAADVATALAMIGDAAVQFRLNHTGGLRR